MIEAKKKFGQNFLKNKDILQKISDSIEVSESDLIIEIGPGMGALTNFLAQKGCSLLCYEIDQRMEDYLNSYVCDKVQILYSDFLKRNVKADIEKIPYRQVYVVSNIPYYITTPILLKLMDLDCFTSIVLLVQKEYGERVVAKEKSKNYNALTLLVDYGYNSEIIMDVDKRNFTPVPKVDSVVLKLNKKTPLGVDKEKYISFIKMCFKNKRKTLKNNLSLKAFIKIKEKLRSLGYSENVRAEEIRREDYKELFLFLIK